MAKDYSRVSIGGEWFYYIDSEDVKVFGEVKTIYKVENIAGEEQMFLEDYVDGWE
ncbi:hypothetical protein [Orenia marismortui]|uniref:Uncharacterized protein n=1 Tax=Orenia marismortui TaxID=46469 RepID=A0A4R8GVS3_9FIRM|nr:hypothetical protein [Orenia marismortui]TDX49121.1 hypothetical protein C7959_12015 [Orenia marismortui]